MDLVQHQAEGLDAYSRIVDLAVLRAEADSPEPAVLGAWNRVRPVPQPVRAAQDGRWAWCATVPSQAGRAPRR